MTKFIIFFTFFFSNFCFSQTQKNYIPKKGFVPNKETAIKIALAIWEPIYGKKHIDKQKPTIATLKDGIWYLHGTLPKGCRGGTAMLEIDKKTGKILKVGHGK
jgi:hypothetical protein